MLATHRGFSLTGRLSLRRAVIGQGASDTVHMLWPDGPGTVYFESECHKNMWGPRAGLDLRAPLAGGAALELSAGWTSYAVRLRDNDAYYSSENRSGRDESRTEGLPDFTASLWVPIGDHFGLRSGYYWENWGSGWTGDLRSSGLFFATTFVIGH